MLKIVAKCDHCGKEKSFVSASVLPEHKSIIAMLKRMGWMVHDVRQFCSYKCEEDHQLQCEHNQVIKKDGYSECVDCGKFWEGK